MANTIRRQGIVEDINNNSLFITIIKTSDCAACSVKEHCISTKSEKNLIVIATKNASSYNIGDDVWVIGEWVMGVKAIVMAFVLPFVILIISLFVFIGILQHELSAALCSLCLLIPYYYILWLCRKRLEKTFTFSVEPFLST